MTVLVTNPASPGGSTTQLQVNTAGAFAGVANVTSDGTNLTGIRVASANSLDWDSGAAAVDLSLFRDAAQILAQRNGVNAQTLRVYNTYTDAANYERGVFDWTTSANTLTIGTQALGTGTTRAIAISAQGAVLTIGNNATLNFQPTSSGLAFMYANTWTLAQTNASNIGVLAFGSVAGGGGYLNADTLNFRNYAGTLSVAATVPANNVFAFSSGWTQWAGQSRVSSNVTSSSTTLANVTGLSATLANARNYSFRAELFATCSSSGGIRAALSTTSTSTGYSLMIDGYAIDGGNTVRGYSQQTAVGSVVIGSTITNTSLHAHLWGTITTSSSMVVNIQFSQQNLSITQTIVQQGSYMLTQDMP